MNYLSTLIPTISALYIIISMVIEIIDIIFLLTPTDKDDSWGAILLAKWEGIGKYVRWFTIKTPTLIFLEYILNALTLVRTKLQAIVAKRREHKSKFNEKDD